MSVFVFAGASQFVAVGYVAGGLLVARDRRPTAFLNARHLLYAAALAPYLADRPRWMRAAMAHVLTDEAFALAIAHFRRIGRGDVRGYWMGAIVSTFIPWNVATLVGVTIGGSIPEPDAIRARRHLPGRDGRPRRRARSRAGASSSRPSRARSSASASALAWDPAAGIIAGGVLGPLVGMAVRPGARRARARGPARVRPGAGDARARRCPLLPADVGAMPTTTRSGRPMSTVLVPLAILMGLVDLPVPRVPLLAPGLRAAAGARPAVPAARRPVGAGGAGGGQHDGRPRRGRHPAFHVGAEWLAVGLCIAVVAMRRSLLDRASCLAAGADRGRSAPRGRAAALIARPRLRRGRASASISTSSDGSMSAATTTAVEAGRTSPKTSPWTSRDRRDVRRGPSRTSASGRRRRARTRLRRAPAR